MTLLAAGCSWTDENYKSQWNHEHVYTRPWPSTLAKMMGMDCKNVGLSGNCIEGVCRDVVTNVLTYDIKFVAVMLPPWIRFRFGDHNLNPYSVYFNNHGYEWKKDLRYATQEYLYYHQSAKNTIEHAMTWFMMLTEFLESREIPYLICQGGKAFHEWHTQHLSYRPDAVERNRMHHYVHTFLNHPIYDELKDKPELMGFPWSSSLGGFSMKDRLRKKWGNKKYTISGKDAHPSDEGHDYMAEIIYEWIQEKITSSRL